ncbi:hypothetical protein [Pseudosulfitobacter pseudonitzschiae]|uniref:hypothetical protein n=1 Tax=Pseudosulfitobacter pseudonitzschiae TaxID=1402135 RepID=UPI003B7EEED5
MKQFLNAKNRKASIKVACIAAGGCLVGSYAINQTILAVSSGMTTEEVSQAFPEMMMIEVDALAEKDAKIVSLEAAVDNLQVEKSILVSENIELISDLAGLVIETTGNEALMPEPEAAAYIAPDNTVPADTGNQVETTEFAPDGIDDEEAAASTYLAFLHDRYADLQSAPISGGDVQTLAEIQARLDKVDREAILFADGMKFDLTNGQREIYEQYRVALLSHQGEVMPVLRDALGPAMRAELGDQGYSMVTSGKGYRTATLKSDRFSSTTEIENFHTGIHEMMVRMRFKEVIYMDAGATQIHGVVDLNPIPDDSLLINDKIN